jgi:peptide/nickel transport system substrate-binding protein
MVALTACLCLSTPASAQTLKYIETSKPEVLNPIEGYRDVTGVRIMELLFRGLLSQDDAGEWTGELASQVPVYQKGDDEIIVTLRAGLLWPDGYPLTATDVKFSFDVFMDPRNSYGNSNIYEIFSAVEVVDEQHVRFRLRRSHRRALSRLGFAIMPKHLLKKTYLDPRHGFSQRPMGAGPFAVTHAEDNLLRFARNANYPGKQARIDSIELVVNAADAVHAPMLLSDLIHLDPVVRPEDLPQIRSNALTAVRPYDSKAWSGFAYNNRNSVLRFKEVRQALTFLFNRQQALNANFFGQGALVSGPYTQSSFCWNPNVRPREHDPIAADKLLDEVGLLDLNDNGIREFNGEDISLRMVLSRGMSDANKNVCADFAQQAGEHMIEIVLDYQDEKTWYEQVFYDRDYDISFVVWKFDDASNVYPLFSLTQQDPGQYNMVQFSHDGVEELLDRFRRSADDTERTEVGKRLHALLHEEVPYTFLWTVNHNAGLRIDRIKKIDIDPFYFFRTIEDWEMSMR